MYDPDDNLRTASFIPLSSKVPVSPIVPMKSKAAKILISSLPIRLGQFLKLAEMVQDGLEAKIRIQNGEVHVNGHVEIRRGKQLRDGDQISLGEVTRLVCQDTI